MRNLSIVFIFLLLIPASGFCAGMPDENQPLTLEGCYQLALKQSELIAIDAERIKEAEAHFLEVLGAIMPQVSFSRTQTWQDPGSQQSSGGTPFFSKTFEQKFVFTQVLFSGFKEFAGMAGGHFEKNQRKNEKLRAEQLLFVDVSDAFYLLMETREDLKVLETISKAFTDRMDELKARVDIGKSRMSEVVSTETQLYSILDEIETVKNQEQVVRELLEFLVGRPINKIADYGLKFTLKSESEYLAKATSRSDVTAAHFAWKVDKEQVTIAKSGFLPTISLGGDYFNHRSSAPEDSKWDAMLTINFPIFEGTTTYGFVKEAKAKAKESELTFQRSQRLAAQDIHDAYVNIQADIARSTILDKALHSAELNYKLQREDYDKNVVNNLDVLAAIQNLENIRRSYFHIFYESKRFYWQLLVATGDIDTVSD